MNGAEDMVLVAGLSHGMNMREWNIGGRQKEEGHIGAKLILVKVMEIYIVTDI